MSEGFGLTPDPKLLSELAYLEDKQRKADKLQADIAGRVGQAVINFKDPKNKQANPVSNLEPMSGMTGSVTAREEYERKTHYPDGAPIPATLPPLYQIQTNKDVPADQNCKNCGYMEDNGQCSKWHAAVRPNYWCAKWKTNEKNSIKEEVLYAANKVQSTPDQIADYITKNPIKETVISQGDPVLAQQGGSLAAQVKRLEAWVSKLGAAGPGSGAAWLWDLGDVQVNNNLSSGQTIIYDAGRKKWINYTTTSYVVTASTSTLGVVQPDNTSIVVTNGIISATLGGLFMTSYTISTYNTSQNITIGSQQDTSYLIINRYTSIFGSGITVTNAVFTVNGNVDSQQVTNSGTMTQIIGQTGIPNRNLYDSFGTGMYNVIAGRQARGTAASPTATQAGDVMMRIAGNGYGNNSFNPGGVARIDFVAAENYTNTSKGSYISFTATRPGTNTLTSNIVVINDSSITLGLQGNTSVGIFFGDGTRQFTAPNVQRFSQVYSRQNQTSSATSAQAILLTTSILNTAGIVLQGTSSIALSYPGTYSFYINVQLQNTDNAPATTNFWMRLNGTDVPASAYGATTAARTGGPGAVNGTVNFAFNVYVQTSSTSDTLQIMWWGPTTTSLFYQSSIAATASSPAIPESPSVVVNIHPLKVLT